MKLFDITPLPVITSSSAAESSAAFHLAGTVVALVVIGIAVVLFCAVAIIERKKK